VEVVYQRCAGLDVGRDEVVACTRVPAGAVGGGRRQEVRTYKTFSAGLAALGDWLGDQGVTRVADGGDRRLLEGGGAPRGAAYPGGGERTPPAACRSRPLKLGQPEPGGAGEGGSSPDNDGAGQHRQMVWVRQARREGVSRAEPVVNPP
jgi:hypothetical protein